MDEYPRSDWGFWSGMGLALALGSCSVVRVQDASISAVRMGLYGARLSFYDGAAGSEQPWPGEKTP